MAFSPKPFISLVTVPDVRLYDRGGHPARGHPQGYGEDRGRGRTQITRVASAGVGSATLGLSAYQCDPALYELPTLLDKDPSLAEFFRDAHGIVWILLLVAVIVHAGGALYHHFIVKDDVLRRMGFCMNT